MSDRLFAFEAGSGPQTIVFLHGFAGGHFVWKAVQGALSGTFRTIAYDLPGHGGSLDFPDAGPPKVAARAVLADLEARGIEKAHVVGHSMGGAVATLMALFAPERVASLTLLAPGGYGETINASHLRSYAAARTGEDVATGLAEMYAPGVAIAPETIDDYANMVSRPGQAEKLSGFAADLFRGDRQGVIPAASLEALRMPVTVFWGEMDAILPFEHTANLPPNFVLEPLPGAGHMLPDERSAEIVGYLRRRPG